MTPLILASGSIARARLLSGCGLPYRTDRPSLDEQPIKDRGRAQGHSAQQVALELAIAKAEQVAPRHPDGLILSADQILDLDGEWFDKPRDMVEAESHLKRLRGRTHRLVNALCLNKNGETFWTFTDEVRLTMREFSDEFVAEYLKAEGEVLLRGVGAYRLEGAGVHLFSAIEGDFFGVLGLPLLPLLDALRVQGIVAD